MKKLYKHKGFILISLYFLIITLPFIYLFIDEKINFDLNELFVFDLSIEKERFIKLWIAACGLMSVVLGAIQIERRINRTDKQLHDSRFHSGVELLGNGEESVRIGGIYTLYFLANECYEYREPICEIFCAHIRNITTNSKYKKEYEKKASNEVQTIIDLLFKKDKNYNLIFNDYGKNFNGAFLYGVNMDYNLKYTLTNVDFNGSTLSSVYFGKAILNKVNFIKATLSNVNFFEAKLNKIDFSETILNKVYFVSAKLNSIDLYRAKLNDVIFTKGTIKAILNNINFSGATLNKIYFRESKLKNIAFNGATLDDVDFTEAELSNIDFYGAILIDLYFASATLNDVNFNKTILENYNFEEIKECSIELTKKKEENIVDNA